MKGTGFDEAIRLCQESGIRYVGVWRETLSELGMARCARQLKGADLLVSSLCRGGFFTSLDPEKQSAARTSNRAAILEAEAIGSPCLVLVCGGLADAERDLPAARGRVVDAISDLVPFAASHGVRLAIEPLHPMFCADRAVVSTLGQALDIAEAFPADTVGVVVDSYHVWWDPALPEQIARAAGRIASFQVGDWVVPLPRNMLLGRGQLGDGSIDFRSIADMVTAAGYKGSVEVEIFNETIWAAPPDRTVAIVKSRFREHLGRNDD